jgi:UDP-glucose 4-epimerase
VNAAPARILLTGGAGYIGSHTALALIEAGHEVVVIDNLVNSKRQSLDAVMRLTGKTLRFHALDLREGERVRQVLEDERITAVVHLAGLKAVGESSADPLGYVDNNVIGSLRLLQAMAAAGVRQLVFSSSATVYGAPMFLPYTEAHPTQPGNPYGQTKRMVEILLQDLCASAPGWHFSVLRYFNPVGAHQSGELGEDPRGVPNNLMPFLAQVAVGQRETLTVHGADYDTVDGTGVRDYLHVCDLAEGHLAALQQLRGQYSAEHSSCEIFNLGSGQGHSVLQLLAAFEAASGQRVATVFGPRRAGDLPAFWADASKAEAVLGWRARRDLHSMCESTWRWQQKHPHGFSD